MHGGGVHGGGVPGGGLRSLYALFDSGGLVGGPKWVHGTCTRVLGLSVDPVQGVYTGQIEISDGGGFECSVQLDAELIASRFGHPATAFLEMLTTGDKATKKRAKELAKGLNAHLNQLSGGFCIGAGPNGLVVHSLPERGPG